MIGKTPSSCCPINPYAGIIAIKNISRVSDPSARRLNSYITFTLIYCDKHLMKLRNSEDGNFEPKSVRSSSRTM